MEISKNKHKLTVNELVSNFQFATEPCRVTMKVATTSAIFNSPYSMDDDGKPARGMMVGFNVILGKFNVNYLMNKIIPEYGGVPWNTLFGINEFEKQNPDGGMLAQVFIQVNDDNDIIYRGSECEVSLQFRKRNKPGTEDQVWLDDPENPDLIGLKLAVDPKSIKVLKSGKANSMDAIFFGLNGDLEDQEVKIFAETTKSNPEQVIY